MKYYIGIDLGGTNIVAGVVNESYEILAKASVKTNLPRPEEEIAADMAKVSQEAAEKAGLTMADIEWIGVGTPGVANSATGVIEYSNNLGFNNTPMVKYLETALGKPTFIENDANAAAYGEYVAGAAKGAKNAVCITLGTGVGAGIVIDGKIYSGSNFGGAEVGHTVISVDGPQCTCGRKGCFEVYSSATGLVRMTKEALAANPESAMKDEERISARTAFNYMRAGDATAKQVVDDYIKYLADARLINMVYPKGEEFPKKPSKIMMHNSNLMYSIYPVKVEEQDVLDTFFANTMWKDHKVNKGDKNISFMVDEVMPFKICPEGTKIKNNPGVTYVLHKAEIGRGNQIPLWLFGFLY